MRPLPPPEPKKVPEKKVEKKKPEKKVAKKPPPPPPASKVAQVAKAEVQQSNRTAAQQTSAGSGSAMTPAKWQVPAAKPLERARCVLRALLKAGGTPKVRFVIDDVGMSFPPASPSLPAFQNSINWLLPLRVVPHQFRRRRPGRAKRSRSLTFQDVMTMESQG